MQEAFYWRFCVTKSWLLSC